MKDEEVMVFHREVPPFKAARIDWRDFPDLSERTKIPPPAVLPLPRVPEIMPLEAADEELPSRFSPLGFRNLGRISSLSCLTLPSVTERSRA